MSTKQTFKKTPPVFSFQRLMMVTDGGFYNEINGHHESNPLQVTRHGIRGTQNTDSADKEVSNIQQTDTAKTDLRAQALVVRFGLRMLDLEHGLFACAGDTAELVEAVKESVSEFAKRAKASKGLEEVSLRIARNIASGAWLWRNRTAASKIEIRVVHSNRTLATFEALVIPTSQFSNYSDEERKLAAVVAAGMRGDTNANLEIIARLEFGIAGPVEVFPSQAYLEEKPKGFARPLYKISPALASEDTDSVRYMGQAALRDQKIANRLRAFDTWYDGYELTGKALPIEPNGASLEFGNSFRTKTDSAFDMFARLNTIDPDSDEGMYCIGVLIRGGVLSKSGKAAKKAEAALAESADQTAEA